MAAIHKQGRQILRNAARGIAGNFITHVGVTTDNTAFDDDQTELDPANVGGANLLIKPATATDEDDGADIQTDFTITIDGDSEMTNKDIATIGAHKGSSRTDSISRTVRNNTIGVQAGDLYTIGIRYGVEDNSP